MYYTNNNEYNDKKHLLVLLLLLIEFVSLSLSLSLSLNVLLQRPTSTQLWSKERGALFFIFLHTNEKRPNDQKSGLIIRSDDLFLHTHTHTHPKHKQRRRKTKKKKTKKTKREKQQRCSLFFIYRFVSSS